MRRVFYWMNRRFMPATAWVRPRGEPTSAGYVAAFKPYQDSVIVPPFTCSTCPVTYPESSDAR